MSVFVTRKCTVLAVCAMAMLAMAQPSFGVLTYFESGGVVVGEGEIFSSRTVGAGGTIWTVKPGENAGTGIADGGPIVSNFRGTGYVQTLPDNLSAGGPNADPFITYNIEITTPGTYQLYLRWDGNNTNGTTQGQSDSMFADIVELKDGPGGTIADHYEFQQGVNGNFASPAWDAGAGFEQNTATPSNGAALFALTAGTFTLRLSQREDGAAVDAWVLQLSNLAAPTGNGPATSVFADVTIPEPATATLGLFALLGMARRRRRA